MFGGMTLKKSRDVVSVNFTTDECHRTLMRHRATVTKFEGL